MKIYTVMGTTGEYSDRCEWPVVSYTNENLAKEHVIKAEKRAKEWEATRKSTFDEPPLGWSKYDPDFDMDYTNTSYYIIETELIEGNALWQVETT